MPLPRGLSRGQVRPLRDLAIHASKPFRALTRRHDQKLVRTANNGTVSILNPPFGGNKVAHGLYSAFSGAVRHADEAVRTAEVKEPLIVQKRQPLYESGFQL